MIVDAPEIRAPCMALSPSGPHPTTATVDPGSTSASAWRRRRTETGHADAAAHHPELGRIGLGKDRHDPFFERHHQLGEPADVRVGIHRRAVAHVRNRDEIVRALTTQELAHVGTAAKALIAGAALRRAGHAHTIAHLHATHFGTDCLDDAHAAVALNQRPASPCASGGQAAGPLPGCGGAARAAPGVR